MLVAMTILRTPWGGLLKAWRCSAEETEECRGTIQRLVFVLAVAVSLSTTFEISAIPAAHGLCWLDFSELQGDGSSNQKWPSSCFRALASQMPSQRHLLVLPEIGEMASVIAEQGQNLYTPAARSLMESAHRAFTC